MHLKEVDFPVAQTGDGKKLLPNTVGFELENIEFVGFKNQMRVLYECALTFQL